MLLTACNLVQLSLFIVPVFNSEIVFFAAQIPHCDARSHRSRVEGRLGHRDPRARDGAHLRDRRRGQTPGQREAHPRAPPQRRHKGQKLCHSGTQL